MSRKVEVDRTATTVRFPSDMLKKIKIRCIMEDMKINDYVLSLVEGDMEEWEKKNPSIPV